MAGSIAGRNEKYSATRRRQENENGVSLSHLT
jgi:hypothetical protein